MASPQQRASLRVCASCQWIFTGGAECPKCAFGSYGARFVFGAKAYRFKRTQKPWFDQKLLSYAHALRQEINP